MDGTIICQGSFIVPATVINQVIAVPSGIDWMHVRNWTQYGTNGAAAPLAGNDFFWQRGMPAGSGIVYYHENGQPAVGSDVLASGGFTLYDPSGQSAGSFPLLGNPVVVAGISNATQPVVTTAVTAGVAVGSVVRLYALAANAQRDVDGIDFVVGAVNPGVSFTLLTATNALANVPGAGGSGAGFYRIVNFNPLFYPRNRIITNITQAANAQVSTAIAHGLTPGQAVRFNIQAKAGMIQLSSSPNNNYLLATVVSVVDDYNFTIDINTTNFSAFTWPTLAQQPSSFPQVIPVGENTAVSLASLAAQTPSIGGRQIFNTNTGLLADSTVNTGVLGMILGTGGLGTTAINAGNLITGPAGTTAGDVVYWVAGKSSFGGL